MTQEKEREVSVQADQSFSLGSVKTIPDLSIEVVVTSGGVDKLARYQALGVPEVWFWQDRDYGKLQYQQSERQKQTSRPSVKEVKFRPNIGESDYVLRIKRAAEWLEKGDSVKFLVRLRGREHQHRDRATDLLNRVVEDLNNAGKVQSFDQRALTLFLSPS